MGARIDQASSVDDDDDSIVGCGVAVVVAAERALVRDLLVPQAMGASQERRRKPVHAPVRSIVIPPSSSRSWACSVREWCCLAHRLRDNNGMLVSSMRRGLWG